MRTAERAYSDADEQKYLFTRCMVPYHHLQASIDCSGLAVLDDGCGAGAGAAMLANAGASVSAVDFSAEDVALTAATCPRVNAAVADVYALPFSTAAFDLVVSCHVLEHLHEPKRYLREIRRVLRPQGQLWLITPNRLFSSPNGPPSNPFHVKEYFFHEFEGLMRDAFPTVQFHGVTHVEKGAVAHAEHKRSAIHALDRFNLRRFAPARLKAWARSLAGAKYPSELRDVKLDDFAIAPLVADSAVDLMAVAKLP